MKKFKEIIKDGSSAAYGAKGPHQIAGDRKSRYQKCSGAVINALGNIAAFIQVAFFYIYSDFLYSWLLTRIYDRYFQFLTE